MNRKRRRVTIISRESNTRTLDIAMLEAELKARGIDVKVMSRLLTKGNVVKAAGYIGHVAAQEAAILRSDVVVLDTYCIPASMIPHRKGTKVVQMWHALSAIKKFGWQTVGMEGGSGRSIARLMRMHRGYDHVVCASDITAKSFCEAFRVSRDKIVKYGLPRIDYIRSVVSGSRHADTMKRIYDRYPQLKKRSSKKTILYAPTFRMGKAVDFQSLTDSIDTEKYNLVIKLHPLYRGEASPTALRSARDDKCIIFDDDFPSFDWLAAADVIISDYSSLVVEATLADKPLYIYAYDLEEYEENTGLNINFDDEPVSPFVFTYANELAEKIDKDVSAEAEGRIEEGYDFKALRAFRDRYIDIDTGADADGESAGSPAIHENYVTKRLADFIEELC